MQLLLVNLNFIAAISNKFQCIYFHNRDVSHCILDQIIAFISIIYSGAHAYPGELSLAHHGVLFLDELAEFKRSTLEALRGPMEAGEICISRSNTQQIYPTGFQLVAAANPCACGFLDHPEMDCVCTHRAINQYQSRISGPLLERIDIHYKVPSLHISWIEAQAADTSEQVRQRVAACRERQFKRQGMLNSDLKGVLIARFCKLEREEHILLELTVQQKAWSARAVQSVLKIARTSADMRDVERIEAVDLNLAISCRQPFSKKEEGRLYWHDVKKRSPLNY
ncbi:MAG: ATP-binding protein [Alcaligenaceae bacterium]|nr:ATP-binding protein [Alcaligenaceae bacterium]